MELKVVGVVKNFATNFANLQKKSPLLQKWSLLEHKAIFIKAINWSWRWKADWIFFTVEGIFCSASASWPFCNNTIKSDRTEGFHTLQIGSKDFRFKAVKIRSYKSFIAQITPKFRNVKNFDYNFLVKIFGGMKFWRNLSWKTYIRSGPV